MRKGFTVFAAAVAASLLATPLVITATNALATSETAAPIGEPMAVAAIEVAPVAPVAVPAIENCTRKVRVVYSGYGATAPCLR